MNKTGSTLAATEHWAWSLAEAFSGTLLLLTVIAIILVSFGAARLLGLLLARFGGKSTNKSPAK